jgi:hypothetical protein
MKKLVLSAVIALVAFTANAQDGTFKIGINVGVPSGDVSEAYSLNGGLDLAYLFDVSDKFQVGAATGFNNFFGKTIETTTLGVNPVNFALVPVTFSQEIDDAQFIPVAAAARYKVVDELYLGADVGYALGLGDVDGGFYYRPRLGYDFTEKIGANISYSAISVTGGTVSTFGVGFEFSL